MVMALNKPLIPNGELTIEEDPVVTVTLSKIPAELAEKNKARKKKIAMYI
ncbi:hypothetical protein GCM10023315_27770 [Algibacter aquimarinus]|uniref:Uncharacterized protein n=1 Tax=Algibacter aquimarinus TaxID=1136748 RepID=A0ABP9HPN9_9FLAO